MDYYWLSFASAEGNLGVVILEATSEKDAHIKTHLLGLNPGGEVLILKTDKSLWTPLPSVLNRLIPKAEMLEIMKDKSKLGTFTNGVEPEIKCGSVRDIAAGVVARGGTVDIHVHDPVEESLKN